MPTARDLIAELERARAVAEGALEEFEFEEPDELVALKPFKFYEGQGIGLDMCLSELREMDRLGTFDADTFCVWTRQQGDDAGRAASDVRARDDDWETELGTADWWEGRAEAFRFAATLCRE